MIYNPACHHRKSIRLKGYDYSRPGAYFVTICVDNRKCLLGEVTGGVVQLNDAAKMVETAWHELPAHYSGIAIDKFVIMPNHVHGIIVLTVGATPRGCPNDENVPGPTRGSAPTRLSLGDVVQRYKSLTTKRYIDGTKQNGWPPFNHRLWQRNYYEHVIRNDEELNRIREYVTANPIKWAEDENNPKNMVR